MGVIIANNKIHTDPPKCGLKDGRKVDSAPKGIEKCDICYGLPR